MGGQAVFQRLLGFLETAIAGFPDLREGKNCQYGIADLARAAFAVFFCQSPSFLAQQKLMQQTQGRNNGRTLFGIEKLPSDNHIRNHLDPVDPRLLRPVFHDTAQYLYEGKELDRFRSLGGTLLVALDGTGYFRSESIHCPQCSITQPKGKPTVYSHTVVMAAIVAPDIGHVIPLEPEFVVAQDGADKQDCEQRAACRWVQQVAPRYSGWDLTIVADDLYATQPMIQQVLDAEMQYLVTAKEKSHPYLYEEIQSLEKLGELHTASHTRWTGKQRLTDNYRWVNGVRLRNSDDSLDVNWVELTISDQDGKQRFHTAVITSHLITEDNVQQLLRAARSRWKIENEDINTLKTKGYHLEHNFGHGKMFLAQTLLSMNLLAFLFHTVLELQDARCALIRRTLPRRETFFQHLSVLTQYMCFEGWQQLMLFMLEGLKLSDPEG
jgi:hypothetical protein